MVGTFTKKMWIIPVFTVISLIPLDIRAANHPGDDLITSWVKEALKEDSRINAVDIKVTTESGIVRLGGGVPNLSSKKYADLEAKKIDGVRGVINRLRVIGAKYSWDKS